MGKNPLRALPSRGDITDAALQRDVWPENEWSRTDPTEPCSLSPTPVITANDSSKPSSSPPISQAASLSPAMENMESKEERKGNVEEDDDDEFSFVSDVFFMGLEEVAGPIGENEFSDEFPVSEKVKVPVWQPKIASQASLLFTCCRV
ncbi:hypothetical protein LguiB_026866 [Lonicera macranthoides]